MPNLRRLLWRIGAASRLAVGETAQRSAAWYPFSVDVCLNGRLWLAKQMDAAALGYQRADNCFVDLVDPQRAQALADAQHATVRRVRNGSEPGAGFFWLS